MGGWFPQLGNPSPDWVAALATEISPHSAPFPSRANSRQSLSSDGSVSCSQQILRVWVESVGCCGQGEAEK